ncbi:MAG: Various polyols ABC transporter, substrate-binding protein [uncultured Thermomicrobiales bacterium]|uniref:Various polyols ABC transporter, substrate-binding protein n=1 Tax=uncultured Thermomicrobiales bacterium TaxID=1645740 RepID=A0A6J4U3A0_9BACT|nr:MAG: Various polyols ABC transporter, substrate-binding protein [uncultured Thermomicrobiales bacterium]
MEFRRRVAALAAMLALLIPMVAAMGARPSLAQDATPAASPAAAQPDPSITGTIDVGMVANPQMVALQDLVASGAFNALYPNVTVRFTVLPENEIRQVITQDVTTQAGQFDVVTIGPFEVPLWAQEGWLEEVGEEAAADPNYNLDDIFQAHKDNLSFEEGLYALPFYGESSMVFYRRDLFEAAGIQMPESPTWEQIGQFAQQLDTEETSGVCLRGLPGWGEQLAPLTTVINAFGGRWFDEDWNAQLNSEQSAAAIRFYIETLQNYGPAGSEGNGFTECQTLFNEGRAAMWYDATSAAELVTDPELNPNAANVGFAYAPTQASPENHGNWLWNWSFAMAANSDAKDAGQAFMRWATSPTYFQTLVAEEGYERAPTGSRTSTYQDPGYREYAGAFADIVLQSLENANPNQPTIDPVPYTGGQFVRIPEFQQLGNDVSQEFAAAIVGQQSIEEAIEAANDLANQVAQEGGYQT